MRAKINSSQDLEKRILLSRWLVSKHGSVKQLISDDYDIQLGIRYV